MLERRTLESYVDAVAAGFSTRRFPGDAPAFSALSLAEAYEVQEGALARRGRTSGAVVGWKVGCTSPAIRAQFGLKEPISGRLFEREIHSDETGIRTSDFVDCAIEPEFVFTLCRDLAGDPTEQDLLESIRSVAVGIELHNYRFWQAPPTSQELIAFNGIHAGLVIGPERPFLPDLDLGRQTVSVRVNGDLRATGPAAEIMGGPLRSLRWLARHAAERGQKLSAGDKIIPGSAVELVRVRAGDAVEAAISGVGACGARFV